jgi:bloom syndrome protein
LATRLWSQANLGCVDNDELLEIDGIEPDKVDHYGSRFLKLIRNYQESYESMMRQQEDIPDDPNHRTVVDLLSSDEDDPPYSPDDEPVSSQEERSSYFSNPVNKFNEQCKLERP